MKIFSRELSRKGREDTQEFGEPLLEGKALPESGSPRTCVNENRLKGAVAHPQPVVIDR